MPSGDLRRLCRLGCWVGFRVLFGAVKLGRPSKIGISRPPPPWPVGPQDHAQKTQKAKVVGFRVTNNLVSHSKGEKSPRRGSLEVQLTL